MSLPPDRKNQVSKRSATSYSSDEWKRHRPTIARMYFEEGKTLKEVREYLADNYYFTPSERMYKSRLHSWGLDKKKKEHEMLEIVRLGTQNSDNKDKSWMIRGRPVTLADAMHYFSRKGVKDPTTLLNQSQNGGDPHAELSSPDDVDVKTPLSANGDFDSNGRVESDYDFPPGSPSSRSVLAKPPTIPMYQMPTDFAEHRIVALQAALNVSELPPIPAFRTVSVESLVTPVRPEEAWTVDKVVCELKKHYEEIFRSRGITLTSPWTASSHTGQPDQFHTFMYQGYSSLWNGQTEEAAQLFQQAFALIPGLVKDNHVAFLILVLDLVTRYDATNHERPLLQVLEHIASTAKAEYNSETTPIYLITTHLLHCNTGRASVAEAAMRKLLDYFQDSIGYFHQETIALLQMFANALFNRKHYVESAARFQQLIDAFETTQGKHNYQVCYSLRSCSEAYFHMDDYVKSLTALKAAIDRSRNLSPPEEREIYVRCLRGMAEISQKLGRHQEAVETMRYVHDATRETFGAGHVFTERAAMHLKTIEKGESAEVAAIPPEIYRLGRGGPAANYVWTTRTSPTRLEA